MLCVICAANGIGHPIARTVLIFLTFRFLGDFFSWGIELVLDQGSNREATFGVFFYSGSGSLTRVNPAVC